MRKHFLYWLICLAPLLGFSQNTTLRGTITDADNGQPLIGANITVTTLARGMVTDSLGRFRFTNLNPGRYTVEVSYLGYQQLELKEILLTSGKEMILDISLQEAPTSLTAITVKGNRGTANSPNLYTLTQEETLRYPATFFDPGRLATAYPGVAGSNDQANHLIIRGQAPGGMHWRLEGLEIVNPNHTPNAGTFSDRTTVNGGGVNAISAQLLSETQFYLGTFPAGLGNATAGLLDMRLRSGNNERAEHTIQAGVIGVDLATEGPIGKQGASYLVNYRYSFTGLLSDLGVPLGDEDIRFQDLSFNVNIPGKNNGRLKLFGLFGQSSNYFERPTDTSAWDTDKYLYRFIDFDARFGVAGFHYTRPRGNKGQWTLAGAWSAIGTDRLAQAEDIRVQEIDDFEQEKISLRINHRWKLLPFGSLDLGIEALNLSQAVERQFPFGSADSGQRSTDGLTLSPYFDWQYQIKKVKAQLGYRASIYTNWLDEQIYSEPRLTISYLASKQSTIGINYSQATQAPSPYVQALRPRQVQQFSLFWTQRLRPDLQLSVQAYRQHLRQISGTGTRSTLHQLGTFNIDTEETSRGRNQGVELGLQRFASGDWWYQLSASIFRAEYEDEAGDWQLGRFATDYNLAVTLGKEWNGKDRHQRPTIFGANFAVRTQGGQRALPIDLVASQAARTTIFDYSKGFTEQLPAYFRVDFRMYYQTNRPKWNSMLSLDIQNVSGQENVAHNYYDRLLNAINERVQLEFIPVISYRVNF